MKYRSRTEIVGLILEAANGGGATKTKIMYKAFLSFAQLREYLTTLQDNELIEYDHQTYRTTEKGMRLLQIYNKMYELAPLTGVAENSGGVSSSSSSSRYNSSNSGSSSSSNGDSGRDFVVNR
jgi:predicted transcriptional regulator